MTIFPWAQEGKRSGRAGITGLLSCQGLSNGSTGRDCKLRAIGGSDCPAQSTGYQSRMLKTATGRELGRVVYPLKAGRDDGPVTESGDGLPWGKETRGHIDRVNCRYVAAKRNLGEFRLFSIRKTFSA